GRRRDARRGARGDLRAVDLPADLHGPAARRAGRPARCATHRALGGRAADRRDARPRVRPRARARPRPTARGRHARAGGRRRRARARHRRERPVSFTAPEIAWGALTPVVVMLGAAVLGVLVEAFVPERARRGTQLVLAFAAPVGAIIAVA